MPKLPKWFDPLQWTQRDIYTPVYRDEEWNVIQNQVNNNDEQKNLNYF
jgi:hypothetical protein